MAFNTTEYLRIRKKLQEEKKQEQKEKELTLGQRYMMLRRGTPATPDFTFGSNHAGRVTAAQENDGYFKAGALRDGVSIENVGRAILGTTGDVATNAVMGLGSLVEGVTDLLGYAGAGIADLFGADQFAGDWKKSVQRSTVDDIFGGIEGFFDRESILGEKSDNVVQGLGQVAGIILTAGAGTAAGLGSAGVTALTTGVTGVSGMGSGMSEAYQGGATDGEALTYGLISGAAEAGMELIFGGLGKVFKGVTGLGKGLSSADDMLAKKLTSKITSQIGKNLAQWGVKAGAEGTEEVLTGIVQAIGKKATYLSEEELGKIVADERLFEQFITGAITSGIAQSGVVPGMKNGSLIQANKAGADFITGLTKNEQAVVDKEFANRVAEAKKSGEVSKRQESAIYDEVVQDMERGGISTDTIEEVLGGESYKKYQSAVKQEADLKQEIEKLEGIADNSITVKQRERLAEARKELKGLDQSGLKTKLSDEVSKLVQGSKLGESYADFARRGEAYKVDLAKYSPKEQAIYKRHMDSGMVNNRNATHDFIDWLVKMEADKGVTIELADLQKLKDSGFSVDGAYINGVKTGKGILVNINSAKSLNSVVGHEITHVLEGTELYDSLKQTVKEFAEAKGIYQSRYDAVAKLYEKVQDADIEGELTADLVGDYLFADKAFVESLSTKNRNLFQKIFDEIKYLCKIATSGSAEARKLEKVKKTFAEMYRDGEIKNPTGDGGVQYSIQRMRTMPWAEQIERTLYNAKKTSQGIRRNDTLVVAYPKETNIANEISEKPFAIPLSVLTKASTGKDISHSIKRGKLVKLDAGIKNAPITIINPERNAVVFITDITQGGLPIIVSFDMDTVFDGDDVHKATSIHIQLDTQSMLEALPKTATIYVQKNDELKAVGATNNLRGLAANIKFIGKSVLQDNGNVNSQKSLSAEGQKEASVGQYQVRGEDIALEEQGVATDDQHPRNDRAVKARKDAVEEFSAPTEEDIARIEKNGKLDGPLLMKDSLDRELEKLYRQGLKKQISEEEYLKGLRRMEGVYNWEDDDFHDAFRRIKAAYEEDYGAPSLEQFKKGYHRIAINNETEVSRGEYGGIEFEYDDSPILRDDIRDQNAYNSYLRAVKEQAATTNRVSLEDYANHESPVWRNVAYDDDTTKTRIMQETHNAMVSEGAVVSVTQDVIDSVNQAFPDLRNMKKKDRTPILKEAINKLKGNIREFLTGISNQSFEFEVNGKVLDAKLYSTGINEVLEKVTQDKANMLYSTEEIFRNARYLYSTPDYDGDPNVYRWNYFYTPVQIGDEVVGVRIAVRDMVKGTDGANPESQIYNWGIKKDASLDGGSHDPKAASSGVSSDASKNSIREDRADVKSVEDAERVLGDRKSFVSRQAQALYDEVKGMQKGKRVSGDLSYLLDMLDMSEENKNSSYQSLRNALLNVRDNPDQTVNANSSIESAIRELLGREYDSMVEDFANAEGVAAGIYSKMESLRTELENNQRLREESNADFDSEIARLQAEYEAKENKNTKAANDLLRRIERVQRLKSQVDGDYSKRIERIGERLEKMSKPKYKRALQRKSKQEQYTALMAELAGDTSAWKDKKMGISYSTTTLRRNLRDVVRDSKGNWDIARADAIYDELQGNYNHNEAEMKRESARLKKVFQELNLNHAEGTYAHMLGEIQYNPDSKLSMEVVEEFYEKHKKKIDTKKVDKAIEESRKVFDELITRMNERLREQGMKEIPYRKGYFPHFTNPKQNWLAKFFNWKPVDNEIPTSIAGMTENFNPQRSWQPFNKQRTGDSTDYSLEQGLDTYIHGALDWIYHIEDIQKRRAFENYIRYIHSEEGIKQRIDEIKNNESYDADEAQQLMDAVYAEAKNPLNNFVTDLRSGTNTLANKKSSMDRKAEEMTNRKIYSVMTNLNSRINANMVVGSFSSALTNFIPITQSWVEVSPVYSLKGMHDTIKATIRSDGVVEKSDFLTNRLMNEEKLYQTGWDKVSEKAAIMMEAIDNFTSQTVWRSKYLQNMAEGMSENAAMKNADQFAENVIAGRSRGNMPTIFDAKNPLTKIFTAFQLEVTNQYGYMFKDAPQDSKNKVRLIKGYATAFLGAYVYNALYSSLVGRDAAFDPIGILEDLFRDLFGDDEEESEEALLNLTDNVLEEVPFIGGLLGGGRVPISSAIPYEGDFKTFITDVTNGELSAKEMLKPIYYLAMPVAGGQVKKTNEGLKMFDDDFPVAGSYTDSGNLRFPVEDTVGNRIQAGIFGQYASQNARDYFDNDWAPLQGKQIEEFAALGIPVADYRKIRTKLNKLETLAEKFDYIDSLELSVEQKNILVNNVVNRKEPVDMKEYELYEDYEEFDFYINNKEKYQFLKDNGIAYDVYNASEKSREAYTWAFNNPEKYEVSKAVSKSVVAYKRYTKALGEIKADKDSNGNAVSGSRKNKVVAWLNHQDMSDGAKMILYKMEYPSDDTYNVRIVKYINSLADFSYEQKETVLKELGFKVDAKGNISW